MRTVLRATPSRRTISLIDSPQPDAADGSQPNPPRQHSLPPGSPRSQGPLIHTPVVDPPEGSDSRVDKGSVFSRRRHTGHSGKSQSSRDACLLLGSRLGVHFSVDRCGPRISRRSVGSHDNPTDSDFAVTSPAPGRRWWRSILAGRCLHRSDSIGPPSPVGRNKWVS